MYARVTQLEIDTLRISTDEALALFEEEVLPDLRQQTGYRGIYVLATPDGRGVLISLWDTAEQADAGTSGTTYAETLGRYLTLFKTPPGREHYEVRLADIPANATQPAGE
jgi:heme-degrading monooxygenase HmoA